MTASNIQKFDEITGQVFGALYESFPVPRRLFIKDFLDDGFSYNDHVQAELPSESGSFFMACIDWLAEAGYLRYEGKLHYSGFGDVVLTGKGLEALKALPASLSAGPSLGEQLVDATKSGTRSALGSLAGEVLSIGSRIVTSHLGLPG